MGYFSNALIDTKPEPGEVIPFSLYEKLVLKELKHIKKAKKGVMKQC